MEDARQYTTARCQGCLQTLDRCHCSPVTAPHPRCECHSCTQSRRPQPTGLGFQVEAAITAERDRCFFAATESVLPKGDLFVAPPPEVKSLPDFLAGYRYACAQIAAKIRSGE